MDNVGSMNSLRDDTATSGRIGKSASARRTQDQENAGAFGDVLAGLVVPNVVPVQPPVQQATPAVSQAPAVSEANPDQATQTSNALPQNQSASVNATANSKTTAQPVNGETTDAASTPTAQVVSPEALVQSQSESETVLAQLSIIGADDQAQPLQEAKIASAQAALTQSAATKETPANVPTNAATLSASRSNAGVAAASQDDAETTNTPNSTSQATGAATPASSPVSNDNTALVTQIKAKPSEIDLATKPSGQPIEAVSTTLDGTGATSVISGQEVVAPANDQANRAPPLTPQNIPMLAATMMRRLDSGSKQFTMRLDPPELGQVEVRLTVAADKKVRAVVSADRPEALADLVRSARELMRALAEAGLDLEDNGLTFSMNDPSAGGQHQETSDHRNGKAAPVSAQGTANSQGQHPDTIDHKQKRSDPFERWQRARIALTA